MDERVKTLLNSVRETAGTMSDVASVTARYAGRYAGQMVDIAKLNMRIFDLNAACNELLREVGQVVYDTHLGREPEGERLTGLLREIDGKTRDIAELKERIAALRSGRECHACGALCGREDKYCKECGAALKQP